MEVLEVWIPWCSFSVLKNICLLICFIIREGDIHLYLQKKLLTINYLSVKPFGMEGINCFSGTVLGSWMILEASPASCCPAALVPYNFHHCLNLKKKSLLYSLAKSLLLKLEFPKKKPIK